MFKKGELKLLSPFYAHSLIFNLTKVIMPFYVLYFLGIGLSFLQISLISGIRSAVAIIFEIPTGVIADKYGRKNSVIFGYLFTAVSLALIPLSNNFYIIAAIFAIDAFFETFINGADRAWAVDLIKSTDESLLDRYFLKTRLFRNIGMIIAPIIAGFIIGQHSMKILWWVFAAGIIVSNLILVWAKEIRQKTLEIAAPQKQIRAIMTKSLESVKYAFSHKIIFLLLLGIFIFYFVDEITSLVWTPHLQNNGLDLPSIGLLFSIISIIGIAIPIITQAILKRKNKISLILASAICYAVLLFAAGSINSIAALAVIFIFFNSLDEIFLPLEESLINEFIQNQQRATVLSIKSMVESLAAIIGAPLAGLVAGAIIGPKVFMISGILILLCSVIYFFVWNKIKRPEVISFRPRP
ncbi:hypothetical protein A3H03_02260 [Candidatus Kuenenbacteria bacterium RIFCSPLOWO2_12_FULL_42_13]|uniref:Major facilitator superfamily (MFS) profile domain-containing protein n=1 Tax=Candidatus Kuenenbacteria bacterium RIFCSPLOWO2_12_FULL_42_13 TaxID=1798565 RepID=A0A1F6G1I4_9BACT|nr:MAG: hypothetical protein A3H03_02260 [Candidatus Kuenenbacteria bacterium RIFCSPLOWO2_12_FULL_42_13]